MLANGSDRNRKLRNVNQSAVGCCGFLDGYGHVGRQAGSDLEFDPILKVSIWDRLDGCSEWRRY
jgi:hypothetical protein